METCWNLWFLLPLFLSLLPFLPCLLRPPFLPLRRCCVVTTGAGTNAETESALKKSSWATAFSSSFDY